MLIRPVDYLSYGCSGKKYLFYTYFLKCGNIRFGDDAPADDGYVACALFTELPGYLGEMMQVGTGEATQTDQNLRKCCQ